jgi:hypothetical protein
LALMKQILSPAELSARIDQVVAVLDASGIDWHDPLNDAEFLALRGDTDGAAAKILEWLEGDAAHGKEWRWQFSRQVFVEVAAVPAVRARMDELDQQEIAIREGVLAVLAENEDIR